MRKHYMWTWRKENALSWIPRKEIHYQMEEKKKLSNRDWENGKSMRWDRGQEPRQDAFKTTVNFKQTDWKENP